MAEYDPDALNEDAESAEVDGSMTAEIVDIETDVAHNIFGENTQSEPDKEMLIVTAETEVSGETQEVETVYSLPESDQSWLNPTFALARFRAKYGTVPEEELEVEVTANDKGFLDIDIPDTANLGEN